ncbi:MAG: exopolysaccharide biosynthesis protein [Verrucomicrobiae bacterium]
MKGVPNCSEAPLSTDGTQRLSRALRELADSLPGERTQLGDLMDRLQGRVYTLLLVLLCLPFCQPIALPGLSTPFGVVIALLGLTRNSVLFCGNLSGKCRPGCLAVPALQRMVC